MATKAKLNVMFSFHNYSGNGGIGCIHPSIAEWWGRTLVKMKTDDRVGEIMTISPADTPITMVRNGAVRDAKASGADVLVMIDSDQWPDLYLDKDPLAKPFWDSSFNFLYDRWCRGLATVIGAPYCGPSPDQVVYVFKWNNHHTPTDVRGVAKITDQPDMKIEMFSRNEAAQAQGIAPAAALPTGLIMFDMRAFEPLPHPYFYYEWTDETQSEKASTEDVTATRDISLIHQIKYGYSPVYVNWDAWAGHMKPQCVGKPVLLTVDQVGDKYKKCLADNVRSDERVVHVGVDGGFNRLNIMGGDGKPVRIPANGAV